LDAAVGKVTRNHTVARLSQSEDKPGLARYELLLINPMVKADDAAS
jgi:hypothetical protein